MPNNPGFADILLDVLKCSRASSISKDGKEFVCIWCGFTAGKILEAQRQAEQEPKSPWWATSKTTK
jgi:hypothetical protein